MKTIVITGSTRGIGRALAAAFLQQGCQVVISGRTPEAVDTVCAELSATGGLEAVAGFACDVNDPSQMEQLWQFAANRFGCIDIWINNAGLGHPRQTPWDLTPAQLHAVLDTNIVGTVYGTRVAMHGMMAQGGGQIYNLEGHGSRGQVRVGVSVYGTTKAAVTYFTKAMIEEARGTPVQIGGISPGMVMTDMVLDQFKDAPEDLEKFKPIFNTIADRPENVAPHLVRKILANHKHGARIRYLNGWKIFWRFLSQPFVKRDLLNS